MTGYKGIIYRAGILRSKGNGQELGDIFELGVPKQKAAVTGGIGFSEVSEVMARILVTSVMRGIAKRTYVCYSVLYQIT